MGAWGPSSPSLCQQVQGSQVLLHQVPSYTWGAKAQRGKRTCWRAPKLLRDRAGFWQTGRLGELGKPGPLSESLRLLDLFHFSASLLIPHTCLFLLKPSQVLYPSARLQDQLGSTPQQGRADRRPGGGPVGRRSSGSPSGHRPPGGHSAGNIKSGGGRGSLHVLQKGGVMAMSYSKKVLR